MAGLEGLEPPTSGFGDRRSTKLELQACTSLLGGLPFGRGITGRTDPTPGPRKRDLLTTNCERA